MLYTVDYNTLPSFLITLPREIESKWAVTITLDQDDIAVEEYRTANRWRSNLIRKNLKENPNRRSNIVTLSNISKVRWIWK